jgi:hypothetical protein
VGIKSGITVSVVLLLAGCGGGDEGRGDTELGGIFQGGNVIGLHYRTPTREGVTDASGTFKYLAGETVTFSIGAIELGSAPGAAAITPFTLAGLTPPTTELALRRELNQVSLHASPFVKAANLSRLLLALDADGNPSNGIDVRGRDALLANATLDFSQPIGAFASKLDRLAPNLTRNIPFAAPIVHLYRVLNISVPAHATVRQVTDMSPVFPGNGETLVSYLPNGQVDQRTQTDGPLAREYRYTYDVLGRALTVETRSTDYFGTPGFVARSTTIRDVFGNVTRTISDFDYFDDGVIDIHRSFDASYDSFGRTLIATEATDPSAFAVAYSIRSEFTHDARGNLVGAVQFNDRDRDGDIDTRVTEARTFDSRDRLLTNTRDIDNGNDGVIDSRDRTVLTWSGDGRVAMQIDSSDDNGDGVTDSTTTTVWTYDAANNLVSWSRESDSPFSLRVRTTSTMTHDANGRVLRHEQIDDWEGDGDIDATYVFLSTFDAAGNLLERRYDYDYGDGNPSSHSVDTYVYGDSGELLEYRQVADWNDDGTPDATQRMVATHQIIEAGVAMLAYQHFEGGVSYDAGL